MARRRRREPGGLFILAIVGLTMAMAWGAAMGLKAGAARARNWGMWSR